MESTGLGDQLGLERERKKPKMTHSWLWWWVDDEIVDWSVLTSQKNIDDQEPDISSGQVLPPSKSGKKCRF